MSEKHLSAVELRKVDSLRNDPANLRDHPARSIEAIKGALVAFGQQKPIVITKDGVVVAGNGLLMAARELRWKKVACVVTDLEGSEAIRYAIADNRTAETSEWDVSALSQWLQGAQREGLKIDDLGWSPDELSPLLAAEWNAGNEPAGEAAHQSLEMVSIRVTQDQHDVIMRAVAELRNKENDQAIRTGRALELICATYLA